MISIKHNKFSALCTSLIIGFSGFNGIANAQETGVIDTITSGRVGIFACDAAGNKQKTGAIIGAVVGGYIGNRVADDKKTLGTVLGAAVGGAAGSYIGCSLQRKDQERLAADSERALATGQGSIWSDNETGVNANTQVISNTTNGTSPIKIANGVSTPSRLTLIGGRYTANRDVVLRASPIAKGKSVGGIGQSEQVDVIGKTAGTTPWAAIGQSGVLIGYVPLSSLNAVGQIANSKGMVTEGVRIVNVPVTTTCRNITQSVKTDMNSQGQSVNTKACTQPDGSWKPI